MATEATDRLLSEFIDAWNAGRRPKVDDYVERAPEAERDELAVLIGKFLEVAPTPEFSPQQLAEIRRDPLVERISGLVETEPELGPSPLRRLRDQAKLKREDVVARLAEALGLKKAEPKVGLYYHQLENGMLDPAGVSAKVFKALGGVLGVSESELEFGEWAASALGSASPEPLYTRIDAVVEDRAGAPATPPATPRDEWDEVDELFRGGR